MNGAELFVYIELNRINNVFEGRFQLRYLILVQSERKLLNTTRQVVVQNLEGGVQVEQAVAEEVQLLNFGHLLENEELLLVEQSVVPQVKEGQIHQRAKL